MSETATWTTKQERDEQLVAAYRADPSLSIAVVGERFGLSRSAAHTIISIHGGTDGRRPARRPWGTSAESRRGETRHSKLTRACQMIEALQEQVRRSRSSGVLPDGRLRYVLSAGDPTRTMAVETPIDLSQAEADRLCQLIGSLVCEG